MGEKIKQREAEKTKEKKWYKNAETKKENGETETNNQAGRTQ